MIYLGSKSTLLSRTTHPRLLILLVSKCILLLEPSEIVVLRGPGLKRAPEQQLGRKQWGEIHIHSSPWRCNIIRVLMGRMTIGRCVDGHISSAWMPIRVAPNSLLVGYVRAMGETSLIVLIL